MTNDRPHIDYREAFVLDMELAAHGFQCKQCMIAAIHGNTDNFCDRMKHMREYIKRAYQALPHYYKNRYETAIDAALNYNHRILEDFGVVKETHG